VYGLGTAAAVISLLAAYQGGLLYQRCERRLQELFTS
jgi:hypothetical protein